MSRPKPRLIITTHSLAYEPTDIMESDPSTRVAVQALVRIASSPNPPDVEDEAQKDADLVRDLAALAVVASISRRETKEALQRVVCPCPLCNKPPALVFAYREGFDVTNFDVNAYNVDMKKEITYLIECNNPTCSKGSKNSAKQKDLHAAFDHAVADWPRRCERDMENAANVLYEINTTEPN